MAADDRPPPPAPEPPATPDEGRRRLLTLAGTALGLGVAGAVAAPAVAGLLAPVGRRTVAGPDGELDVIALDALPVGEPRRVPVRGTVRDGWLTSEVELGAAWLVRHEDGSVAAFSATCPHLGCAIDRAEGGPHPFFCPCHDSSFRLDGEAVDGPSPRGLDPLPTRVAEGRVLLRFQRFATGISERRGV
jgi:cytochrome b6-f complex iron-sulfur subunit/menaquinol-cytochrome c reductase iron-sulfur subunit